MRTARSKSRLNKEMVELERFTADPGSLEALAKQGGEVAVALKTVMGDMRNQDVERIHALLVRHAHYTNSKKAKTILANFAAWLPKFRKVMPVEYRRALTELAKAAEVGGENSRPQA